MTPAFTTLPAHGIGPVAGLQVAVPGLLAALALAAGYSVQSTGRWLHATATTRHGGGRLAAAASLALVVLGALASAYATARPGLLTAAGAATLLGAGYGLCLSTGLREVQETAAPDELGAVVSIFYSLAYAGLLVPYLLTFLAPRLSYPWALTTTETAAPDELGAVVSIFYSLAYAGLLVPYLLTFLAPRLSYPWALTTTETAAGLSLILVLASRPSPGCTPGARRT